MLLLLLLLLILLILLLDVTAASASADNSAHRCSILLRLALSWARNGSKRESLEVPLTQFKSRPGLG